MEIDDINATYPLFIDPLNTDPVWKKEGEYSGFRFGERAEIVGDVNGDNFDDIMVSAPEFSYPTSDEGIVYLYLDQPVAPAHHRIGVIMVISFMEYLEDVFPVEGI